MQFRELKFGRADQKARTVPVTVSTETPVDCGDFFEILDHSPGSVDLSRAPLPLIESHNTNQVNIGIVESLRLEGNRLRGIAKFGESQRAKEVFADVAAGIITGVSIGYERIGRGVPVSSDGRSIKFKFKPHEVSVVAVPADIRAGFFRSSRKELNIMNIDHDDAQEQRLSRSQRRLQNFDSHSGVEDERERVSSILSIATRHNMRQLGDRAVHEGTSLEVFRGAMLEELERRGSNKPLQNPGSEIGLTPSEASRFSVSRFLRSLVDRDKSIAPFEHECAAAVANGLQRVGIHARRSSNFIPYEVMRMPLPGARMVGDQLMVADTVVASRRDLATSSSGAGGAMVGTDLVAAEFIDLLRNRVAVRSMGARVLGGLVGNLSIPRQASSVSMNWVAQAAAATESDSTYSSVTLTPKTVHGIQDITRELLMQGTPACEGLVRADLLNTMAVQIDYAALHGTGVGAVPLGLGATSGIGAVVGGANGAAPTYAHMVALESATSNANSFDGSFGYLTNSKVRGALKQTQLFAGTNGVPVWSPARADDNPGMFGMVNGYRAVVSNNVRSDLTKGTSAGVCSAVFWGAWSDLLIGEWGVAEILPDELTQAANRIVRIHVYQTVDVAVRRAQSFAMMLDALAP